MRQQVIFEQPFSKVPIGNLKNLGFHIDIVDACGFGNVFSQKLKLSFNTLLSDLLQNLSQTTKLLFFECSFNANLTH